MSQEKTEEPTPKKLRQARERGEIAMSRDLAGAALLATGFAVFSWQAVELDDAFRALFTDSFATAVRGDLTPKLALVSLGHRAAEAARVMTPLFVALVAVGFAVSFLQVGPLLVGEPLKPKLERLNALSGLKRVVASLDSWIELLKGMLKVAIITIIVWAVVQSDLATILRLGVLPLEQSLPLAGAILSRTVFFVVLFFGAIAVIDLLFQRWNFKRRNRMTKDEIKREYKSSEGDPQHKSQRKRLHEEISSGMMVAQVEKADLVVTNPTHIACALRYDPRQEDAPRLVAKGKGTVAQKIREVAKESDVPIIRDVTLARALHEMELDTEIPEDLFDAVAEVLKWVETVAASYGELPTWLEPTEGDETGQTA